MAANPGVYTGRELRAIVASGTRTSFPFGRISRLHRGRGPFPEAFAFSSFPSSSCLRLKALSSSSTSSMLASAASRASCRLRGPTWLLPLKGTGLQRPARRCSAVLGQSAARPSPPPPRVTAVSSPRECPPRPRLRTPRPPPWAGFLDVLCKCSRPKRGLSGWLLSSASIRAVAWIGTPSRGSSRSCRGGPRASPPDGRWDRFHRLGAVCYTNTLRPWARARTHWLESLFSVLSGCTPTSDLAGSRGNSVCDLLGT